MKYEIDIDLGPLADEWEPVAFRPPKRGDEFVMVDGTMYRGESLDYTEPRLIVRRRWEWLEWLTAEWIAMDMDGRWFCYSEMPNESPSCWIGSGAYSLQTRHIAFTPPPCADWRQSKRRNPNAKATT